MARKTAAQKIETLVARTMKQKRGHKLYEYIRKDYGAITDLSDQLWEGYRVGDVSTRTMFHVRGWARDPASYDLEDLIKLANATVEEFPDGVVSEPTIRYSIWTDVPGICSATSSYIEKKLEVEPGFIDEINARIDDFVEPARSAVNHTLAKLNLGDEEASDAALRHEVITTLTDQWSVNLYPPHNSKWTAEQWTAALYEAALGDEVTVINEFALALGIGQRVRHLGQARAVGFVEGGLIGILRQCGHGRCKCGEGGCGKQMTTHGTSFGCSVEARLCRIGAESLLNGL